MPTHTHIWRLMLSKWTQNIVSRSIQINHQNGNVKMSITVRCGTVSIYVASLIVKPRISPYLLFRFSMEHFHSYCIPTLLHIIHFFFFFSGNIHLKMRAIWNRKDKIAVGVIYLLNVGPGVGAKDEKKNRKYTNRQEKCFPPCLAFVATYALIRKIPDRGDSLNFMFQFYGLRLHFCIPDLYENKYKYHYLYKKRRKKRTKQNMRTRQT